MADDPAAYRFSHRESGRCGHGKPGKTGWDACVVKMADLSHNSDLRRLKGISDKDIARAEKYMRFYYELKSFSWET